MAGFVVADFLDAVVGVGGMAEISEGGLVECLDSFLVKIEDNPFCREKVLEQEIVGTGWS